MIAQIIQKDINDVIDAYPGLFKELGNKSFLVTGATGTIGSYVVSLLAENLQRTAGAGTVIAHVRNKEKAEEMFADYLKSGNLKLVVSELAELGSIEDDLDYIIHSASPTQPDDFKKRPVDIIDVNVFVTRNLLEIAKKKKARFCLLSTLEVYGAVESDSYPVSVTEKDFGALDSLDLRSTYPESKRLAENMCIAYQTQYGVGSTIVRLGPVISPIISTNDQRIYAQLIRDVADGKEVTLFSDATDKQRSYTYIADVVSGIFIALNNSTAEDFIFNLANNKNIVSIRGLAERIISIGNSGSYLTIIQRDSDSNTSTSTGRILLDSQKLENIGWAPRYSLDDCIGNTFKYVLSKE